MTSPKPKLIYVGDPMCSWCYGISEELSGVLDNYGDKIDFEIVMGGLRPYNTQKMSELKDFLSHHWMDVTKASGQEFNYGILDSTEITYDTEPPSRATFIVRHLSPKNEYLFFKGAKKLFYKENKNMHRAESYTELLEELNIDYKEFEDLFHSNEMKEKIKLDFARAQVLGVNSFPTIILEIDGERQVIARGFATKEQMIERINSQIN